MTKSVLKSKKVIITVLILLMIVSSVITGVVTNGVRINRIVKENLVLGEKYLSEMKYEEAILVFQEVIKIEPRNVDGYLGISEALVALNKPEEAISWLEKGIIRIEDNGEVVERCEELYIREAKLHQNINNNEAAEDVLRRGYKFTQLEIFLNFLNDLTGLENYEILQKIDKNVMNGENDTDLPIAELSEADMKLIDSLYQAYVSEDFKVVYEIMKSDDYISAIDRLKDRLPLFYNGAKLLKEDEGKGLQIEQTWYSYYGEIVDGMKDGEGILVSVNDNPNDAQNRGYIYYQGDWKNGFPNGYGKNIRVELHNTNNPDGEYPYQLTTIVEGEYNDGLENGSMSETHMFGDGTISYNILYNASEGIVQEGNMVLINEANDMYEMYNASGDLVYTFHKDQIRSTVISKAE